MLSKRTKLMKPSPILALAAKANELKASGKDVVSMTIGEPDWDTFEGIKEAAIASIKEGKTKYTPANGIPDLRKAIAEQTSKDLGLEYTPAQVTVTSGAKFILFAALQCLCDEGDEVILPAPFWASYSTMVELAGGRSKIVVCGPETKFKLTKQLLDSAIGPKTKAIIFNSPSNPTGMFYSRDELKDVAEVLRKHPQVVVISDDIYNRLCHEDCDLAPHLLQVAPDLRERVVVMNGASKSYAMTGWRLGWALGPKGIIDAMTAYQSQAVSCASATSQYAALYAIKNSQADVKKTVDLLRQRRDFIMGELEKIAGIKAFKPDGAFYIWMDVSKFIGKKFRGKEMHGSGDLSAALLDDYLVAVVPGVEFGVEGYFRLSFAIENAKAKVACDRMREFFSEVK